MTVSCSSCHTLILTVLGCIFACGDGSDGQLGHGSLDSSHYFQQIEYFSNPNTVNGENGNQEKKQKYPTFISQVLFNLIIVSFLISKRVKNIYD